MTNNDNNTKFIAVAAAAIPTYLIVSLIGSWGK
jgi:hypothetical protein